MRGVGRMAMNWRGRSYRLPRPPDSEPSGQVQLPPAGPSGHPVRGEGRVPPDVEADNPRVGHAEAHRSIPAREASAGVEVLLAGQRVSGRRHIERELGWMSSGSQVDIRQDNHEWLSFDPDIFKDPVRDREELRRV